MADEVKPALTPETEPSTTSSPIPSPEMAPGAEIKTEVAPAPAEVNKKPHPGGRPTKRDPLTVKKLEEAFSFDATVNEACLYAGITPRTYYTWVKDDPELLQRFDTLRETPVLAARERVVNSIKTDTDTAKWYLERKRKKEFAARTEHTGPEGKDLVPLTEEQEARIKRIAGIKEENGNTRTSNLPAGGNTAGA